MLFVTVQKDLQASTVKHVSKKSNVTISTNCGHRQSPTRGILRRNIKIKYRNVDLQSFAKRVSNQETLVVKNGIKTSLFWKHFDPFLQHYW